MADPLELVKKALRGLRDGELPGVPDEDLEREIIDLLERSITELEHLYDTLEAEEVLYI